MAKSRVHIIAYRNIYSRTRFSHVPILRKIYTKYARSYTVYEYDRCTAGIKNRSRDRRADKESRAINSANIPDIYRCGNKRVYGSRPRVVRKRVNTFPYRGTAAGRVREKIRTANAGAKSGRMVCKKKRRHRAKAEARILVATPSRNY